MKKIFRISLYAAAILVAMSVLSCTKDGNLTSDLTDGITLTFRTSPDAGIQVKSTPTDGDDDFNENLLNSVYYFLYPKDVTDAVPSVSGFKTGLSKTDEYEVRVPVSTSTVINNLFASSNQCQLFAVANPPASLVSALEGTPKLAELRSMVVLSSLTKVPQDNFTMVYDGLVDAYSLSDKKAIDADIPLKHLAVKFTIGALVAPEIKYTRNGVEYTYEPKAVSVSLNNGVNRTTLSGWDKDEVEDADYFSTEYAALSLPTELYYVYEAVIEADKIAALGTPEVKTEVPSEPTSTSPQAIKVDDKYYKLEHYLKATSIKPLYSYPMEWEFNTDTEPYLMYRIDWNYQGSTEDPLPLYYKLTLGRKSITQNEWYEISAKLTIAGSLYPEEPTEIYYYMDYLVNGWKNALNDNGINTPAEIKDTRYLAVSQKEWELNNKNSVTIPFSSSHKCIVANLTAKYTDLKPYTEGGKVKSGRLLDVTTPVSYDLSAPNQITVSHALNNTLGSGMDLSQVVIEFDLQHDGHSEFSEHIIIRQNPAILVETMQNSAGWNSGNTGNYANTYVNGAHGGTSDWLSVYGANASGNNSSIYLTKITVTQFGSSSGYIIGDPRKSEYDNLDNSSTAGIQWNGHNPNSEAGFVYDDGTERTTIKYYHPTVDDGTRDNYVSPSFIVSSGNCRSSRNDTYADNLQRCASYQEDGYPAGRWRLPTLAECKLIQTMSSNGLIPNIFINSSTAWYYYAKGWFVGNADANIPSAWHNQETTTTAGTGNPKAGGAAPRCVYDEWYWSQVDIKLNWDKSAHKEFTWGDVPDDFVIPTPTPTP